MSSANPSPMSDPLPTPPAPQAPSPQSPNQQPPSDPTVQVRTVRMATPPPPPPSAPIDTTDRNTLTEGGLRWRIVFVLEDSTGEVVKIDNTHVSERALRIGNSESFRRKFHDKFKVELREIYEQVSDYLNEKLQPPADQQKITQAGAEKFISNIIHDKPADNSDWGPVGS